MPISSNTCTMCTLSRLPAPAAHFTQRQNSRKAGADNQARWAGAWGGGGSELEVLELREEDMDMRRWWALRRLGERERRWRGLGVEDAYGRRGEREARWGSPGEADVDMGRRWRAWWRPVEQECRSRALGGGGGALGSGSGASERLKRGGAVGSVSDEGGCSVRGGSGSAAVCGTRPRCGANRASQEVSTGPGGPRGVPRGTRGGEGEVPRPPLIRRVGVRRRRQLVVRVE